MAAAGVLGLSAAGWIGHLNVATVSVLDVVLVVFVARQGGFLLATLTSFACLCCLNYFFIPPVLTWVIADAQNWVTLAAFEGTALIVSRLALETEKHATIARNEREEGQKLYEVSRNLLLMDRQRPLGPQIVGLIERICNPTAIVLFDAELAKIDSAGEPDIELEARTRKAYVADRDVPDEDQTARVQVLRFGVRAKGALGLRGPAVTATLMNGLSSLAAIGLEAQRSLVSESRAIAERHAEQMRSAVLDALAHDFKTPLTTIGVCSGGLLESATLSEAERELAGLIQEEVERLNQLTNRLLRTARLDSQDMALKRRSVGLREIVERLAATVSRGARDVTSSVEGDDIEVQIDADLLTLGLGQILDNAIRYSAPHTPIVVNARALETETLVTVTNAGEPIPLAERSRIFDRYYRAGGVGNHVSGTGLGLSVTKKIVEAHSGKVWVESKDGTTTFFVSLPRYG